MFVVELVNYYWVSEDSYASHNLVSCVLQWKTSR